MKNDRGILQVAQRAGVSSATVSRVVTGNAFVSEAMKAKVLKAIEDLQFEPNAMAQGLRTGRSKIVALLVGDIEQGVYPSLTRHIQEALEGARYEALFYNLGHRQERLEKVLERAEALKLGGVILATSDPIDTTRLEPLLARLRAREAFALSVGQSLSKLGIPSIVHDEQAAVEASVQYLCRQYGGSIGFIGRLGGSILGSLRFQGYKSGLEQGGTTFDPSLVCDTSQLPNGKFRFEAGRHCFMKQLRNTGVRAIQASSDELALGAISAILESDLRVPQDIAVAGVGDVSWSAHVKPALTTLGGHTESVAQKLIEMIQAIEMGEPLPSQMIFDRPLIIRESA